MRASRLFCIALAHAGLCPQQQQQLREDVSGWCLGSWGKCVAPRGAVGRGNREVLPHGTFSKPLVATSATNVLGSAVTHCCLQLDSTVPTQSKLPYQKRLWM